MEPGGLQSMGLQKVGYDLLIKQQKQNGSTDGELQQHSQGYPQQDFLSRSGITNCLAQEWGCMRENNITEVVLESSRSHNECHSSSVLWSSICSKSNKEQFLNKCCMKECTPFIWMIRDWGQKN